MKDYLLQGMCATWPQLAHIRTLVAIEKKLSACSRRVAEAQTLLPLPADMPPADAGRGAARLSIEGGGGGAEDDSSRDGSVRGGGRGGSVAGARQHVSMRDTPTGGAWLLPSLVPAAPTPASNLLRGSSAQEAHAGHYAAGMVPQRGWHGTGFVVDGGVRYAAEGPVRGDRAGAAGGGGSSSRAAGGGGSSRGAAAFGSMMTPPAGPVLGFAAPALSAPASTVRSRRPGSSSAPYYADSAAAHASPVRHRQAPAREDAFPALLPETGATACSTRSDRDASAGARGHAAPYSGADVPHEALWQRESAAERQASMHERVRSYAAPLFSLAGRDAGDDLLGDSSRSVGSHSAASLDSLHLRHGSRAGGGAPGSVDLSSSDAQRATAGSPWRALTEHAARAAPSAARAHGGASAGPHLPSPRTGISAALREDLLQLPGLSSRSSARGSEDSAPAARGGVSGLVSSAVGLLMPWNWLPNPFGSAATDASRAADSASVRSSPTQRRRRSDAAEQHLEHMYDETQPHYLDATRYASAYTGRAHTQDSYAAPPRNGGEPGIEEPRGRTASIESDPPYGPLTDAGRASQRTAKPSAPDASSHYGDAAALLLPDAGDVDLSDSSSALLFAGSAAPNSGLAYGDVSPHLRPESALSSASQAQRGEDSAGPSELSASESLTPLRSDALGHAGATSTHRSAQSSGSSRARRSVSFAAGPGAVLAPSEPTSGELSPPDVLLRGPAAPPSHSLHGAAGSATESLTSSSSPSSSSASCSSSSASVAQPLPALTRPKQRLDGEPRAGPAAQDNRITVTPPLTPAFEIGSPAGEAPASPGRELGPSALSRPAPFAAPLTLPGAHLGGAAAWLPGGAMSPYAGGGFIAPAHGAYALQASADGSPALSPVGSRTQLMGAQAHQQALQAIAGTDGLLPLGQMHGHHAMLAGHTAGGSPASSPTRAQAALHLHGPGFAAGRGSHSGGVGPIHPSLAGLRQHWSPYAPPGPGPAATAAGLAALPGSALAALAAGGGPMTPQLRPVGGSGSHSSQASLGGLSGFPGSRVSHTGLQRHRSSGASSDDAASQRPRFTQWAALRADRGSSDGAASEDSASRDPSPTATLKALPVAPVAHVRASTGEGTHSGGSEPQMRAVTPSELTIASPAHQASAGKPLRLQHTARVTHELTPSASAPAATEPPAVSAATPFATGGSATNSNGNGDALVGNSARTLGPAAFVDQTAGNVDKSLASPQPPEAFLPADSVDGHADRDSSAALGANSSAT
jgi:hypothetical protein